MLWIRPSSKTTSEPLLHFASHTGHVPGVGGLFVEAVSRESVFVNRQTGHSEMEIWLGNTGQGNLPLIWRLHHKLVFIEYKISFIWMNVCNLQERFRFRIDENLHI